MSKYSESPSCWDITECKRKDLSLLVTENEKQCWEVVKDDHACSFHICIACLVYLVKQEASHISDEGVCSIQAQREEIGARQYECQLAYVLR